MVDTQHPPFFGVPDDVWSAISAIATAGAVFVALGLPFIQQKLAARQERRDLQRFLQSVADKTYSALVETGGAASSMLRRDTAEFRKHVARATTAERVLLLKANRHSAPDRAIECCLGSSSAIQTIIEVPSSSFMKGDDWFRHCRQAIIIAIQTKADADQLCREHRLQSRQADQAAASIEEAVVLWRKRFVSDPL